jgi:hypothetical protein
VVGSSSSIPQISVSRVQQRCCSVECNHTACHEVGATSAAQHVSCLCVMLHPVCCLHHRLACRTQRLLLS